MWSSEPLSSIVPASGGSTIVLQTAAPNDFSDPSWTKSAQFGVTSTTDLAPDSSNTASLVTMANTNFQDCTGPITTNGGALTPGNSYTFRFYTKNSAPQDWIRIAISDLATWGAGYWINTTTGLLGTRNDTAPGVTDSLISSPAGNGYLQWDLTFHVLSPVSGAQVFIQPAQADGDFNVNVGQAFFFWNFGL